MSYLVQKRVLDTHTNNDTNLNSSANFSDQRTSLNIQLQQQKMMSEFNKPFQFIQNKSAVAQAVEKDSISGWDRFKVMKSDLGKGTGTSTTTRAYVNSSSTPKPSKISFAYHEVGKPIPSATQIDNPTPILTYKSGSYWDAGHKLGKQNGGLGNDNEWVFPQTPSVNQGNTRNMSDKEKDDYEKAVDSGGGDTMSQKWRTHEDAFKELVNGSTTGGYWWFKTS